MLLRLCAYFEARGFVLTQRTCYPYKEEPIPAGSETCNTFSFVRGDETLTLFYEPVVNGSRHLGDNGVGLCRNSAVPYYMGEVTTPFSRTLEEGHRFIYRPDYVLKFTRGGRSDYVIVDAKFAPLHTVVQRYFSQLAYKYLVCISPLSAQDRVLGLCIINGKSSEVEEPPYDAHNLVHTSHPAVPFTKLITLTETSRYSADFHFDLLDNVFHL